MSEYKPTHPEAYTAILNALVDGTFAMLFSDEMTDDEAEILSENLTEVLAIVLEAFDVQFAGADEWTDKNKTFTMRMTVPDRPMMDIIKDLYYEFADNDELPDEEDQ